MAARTSQSSGAFEARSSILARTGAVSCPAQHHWPRSSWREVSEIAPSGAQGSEVLKQGVCAPQAGVAIAPRAGRCLDLAYCWVAEAWPLPALSCQRRLLCCRTALEELCWKSSAQLRLAGSWSSAQEKHLCSTFGPTLSARVLLAIRSQT